MNREEIIKFISQHKAEFEQKFGVTKIGLFGSYARGEGREGSDIDIVVELEKADLFNLIGVKQEIEEAFRRNVYWTKIRNQPESVHLKQTN